MGVNGDLWRRVVPELAGDYRCVAPDLPLGSHSHPLRDGADLSLPGLARILADFVEALGLDDAVVVANDTGGAVAQSLVGRHPERIGALVLTSCDAFEKFPPTPHLYLKPASRVPPLLWLVAWSVRFKAVQRMPTAYGWTTKAPIDETIMDSYTRPVRANPGVRRDLGRLLRAVDTRHTHEAAESLRGFDKPALVVWADGDKLFPLEHGRRLAALLPQGRFETMSDSRTFIPEEQPERLAAMVHDFLTHDQRSNSMTPLITGTDFITVGTRDFDAAVEFYGGVLGLQGSKQWGSMPAKEFETGNLTIAVMQSDAFGLEFRPNNHPIELRVEDFEAARKELESRGVEFKGDAIDSGVCHQAFFEDPDGNTLAIHHRYAPPA